MAKLHEIHIDETIDAPIERVFEHLADHHNFTALFGASCERVAEGEDEPNGLGSVRRIGPGPLSFDETIVVFERPTRIHYRITRGSPLRNHRGEIELSARGDQTLLDYRIRFEGKLPLVGGLVKRALERGWSRNGPAALARL